VQRYLLRESVLALIGRPLLATLAMSAVVWWARDTLFLWSILLGVVVYGTAVFALKTIPEQDKQLLRQIALPLGRK
jgi:hypothetical protein